MHRHSQDALNGRDLIDRIKTHVAQSVAHASLPFTAGATASNCITAAVSTIVGASPIDNKAIGLLKQKGHKAEADMLQRLQYVDGKATKTGPKSENELDRASR